MQKFDILIVGGGMVGLTLALAIRKQTELTVAIVDQAPMSELNEQAEVRVSAINIASKHIFENIDVWHDIQDQRLQPYSDMHIWDKAGYGKLDFSLADIDSLSNSSSAENSLGWIIENKVIRNALWHKAKQDQGISFFSEQALSNIAIGESDVFASFANQQAPIMAKLVVGADGANSWLRQQMDIGLTFRDYDHHAIVATVKCPQGHKNTAWQVFLPTGPLALLPLAVQQEQTDLCSIVWSTSPEEAQRLTALTAEEFAKEITVASDGKLGNISLVSERFTYPLTMRIAQEFVKDRVALVGDAAHTIHPLAGQGVNLGLLDAVSLSQVLAKQIQQITDGSKAKNSWTNKLTLNTYSRWRKAQASEMIVAMEAIKQIFTPQQAPIKLLRGLGLSLLDNIKPAKQLMVKQALGLSGHLPELALKKDTL